MEADAVVRLFKCLVELNTCLKRGDFNLPPKARTICLDVLQQLTSYDVNSACAVAGLLLYQASLEDCVEIATQLLDAGISPEGTSKTAQAPLFWGVMYGNMGVIKLLVERGAKIDTCCRKPKAWRPGNPYLEGCTPLTVAAEVGQLEAAQYLLSVGADFEKATASGATPVFLAAYEGHAAIVYLLAKAGAKLNQETDDGWTPPRIAALNGHLSVCRVMLEAGVAATDVVASRQPSRIAHSTAPPLLLAAKLGHMGVI